MNKTARLLLIVSLGIAACAPQPTSRKTVPQPPETAAAPTPVPEPGAVSDQIQRIATILRVHPEGDAEALVRSLEGDSALQVTLIFPPDYFDAQNRAPLIPRLAALQANKQIEVALALDNEPILPLLADLKVGGDRFQKWGVAFAWPEDAAAQVARGSGRYRKRWGQLASGFSAPYGALSEDVMQVLRRFRLSWVLARPNEAWGVKFFGGTALLVPQPVVLDETAPAATNARDAVQVALSRPFSFVDAASFPTPDFQSLFLTELEKARASAPAPFATIQQFIEGLKNEYALDQGVDPFTNDYSAWGQSPLQRRAWQALSEARQVIENYKNSGRANLNRLDAAVEEMSVAESGPFLLALADTQGLTTFGQRNFLATIANVYRLAGVPVPANLGNWFADRSFHRTTTRPTDNDRPFFVEGPQTLTWNDPKGDDNGPGEYVYPSGSYAKGTFDLRDVTISWTESDVTFSAAVADLPAAGSVAIAPLVDIYVDVNRLSEAGSTAALGKRGQAVIERDAAWEYAVVLTPKNAALFQGLPGGEQRLLMNRNTDVRGTGFSVTLPRKILRGEPRHWRITAAAGGAEVTPRDEPSAPIAVQATASQRAFGGAPGPRMPPRYVDLLTSNAEVQASRLRAYTSGSVILPFVEAE